MTAVAAAMMSLQHMMEEEQEMTNYTNDDLHGWEFKILRSSTGAFNSPQEMSKALQEEAVNGWELMEKFDHYRLRLKRRTDKRSHINTGSALDPYRTQYGITDVRMAMYVVAGTLVFTALLIGAIVYFVG